MYHEVKTRAHKKRKMHGGSAPVETMIESRKTRNVRSRGGKSKSKLVSDKSANVIIDGKPVKCGITDLEENPANQDYTRRNIVTKGALIKVEYDDKKLEAVVTSRPGQDGVINAVIKE